MQTAFGEYYNPEDVHASPEDFGRHRFFLALDRCAPEVRESLYSLLPLFAAVYESGIDDREQVISVISDSARGSPSTDPLEELGGALVSWATKFNINEPWVRLAAAGTLFHEYIDQPGKRRTPDLYVDPVWGFVPPDVANHPDTAEEWKAMKAKAGKAGTPFKRPWNHFVMQPTPEPSVRFRCEVEHPDLNAYPRKHLRKYILKQVREQIEPHLDELEKRAVERGWVKVTPRRRVRGDDRRHYEWTVLSYVLRMTHEEIAEKYRERDGTAGKDTLGPDFKVVGRAIRAVAKEIGLGPAPRR